MRKILLSALVAGGAALALLPAACKAPDGAETARGGASAAATPGQAQTALGAGAPQAPVQPPANVVRRVTVAETKDLVDRGEALVVDVRTKEQYDGGHIKGAVSMPRGDIAARGGELPKDKLLVFYCAWPSESQSAGAALDIKPKGYEKTAALLGGLAAWQQANLPTESVK